MAIAKKDPHLDNEVYDILDERGPLSIRQLLDEIGERNIELSKDQVEDQMKKLIQEGHVTNTPNVDEDGYVMWTVATRPIPVSDE